MTLGDSYSKPSLSERSWSLLRRVEYCRVETQSDRRLIYKLRYRSYLAEKAIQPRTDKELSDIFDEKRNTMVFGLKIDGKFVASIRLHVLSAMQTESPTTQAFGDIIDPIINSGNIIIDPTRFVVDSDGARFSPELPYLALRLPFMAADFFGAKFVLAAVRQEHMAFYQRVLRCSKICEPRNYHQLIKPLGLMMVNYRNEHARVIERFPLFAPQKHELALFAPV